ncbi:hypothetical protein CC86DRAFT_45166 [Ophiobolus disseminans]|uniref:Uncharacterized protein n=1 Tax=Ophiobolus disseminans TaxID=1469910 RepID=A0A6A6ZU82_9PLEO|nr:hypothetical protein CC86DRAFT_45166 [Ophiobolus disseminans]
MTQEEVRTTNSIDDRVQAYGNPIRLFYSLHLQSHEPLAVVLEVPISLNGITLWSKTPIYIKDPHRLEICPVQELGPKFVKGWNSLPTEMKCAILGWALIEDDPIPEPYLWITDVSSSGGHGSEEGESLSPRDHNRSIDYHYENLLSHLRMTPEIATLATRAFYE